MQAVEVDDFFDASRYYSELLECDLSASAQRIKWREAWFRKCLKALEDCDFVFADPDNGLKQDENFSFGAAKDWKSIPVSEVFKLALGRTAVVYHHNTRRKSGHKEEIRFWMNELEASFAVCVRKVSVRTFFVLNGKPHHFERAQKWCEDFGDKCELVAR